MEKLRFKRKNLLNLVDRLHVEKAISTNFDENPNQNLIDQFISPTLLKNPKDELLTVQQGFGSKISRRVYMLRRSRTTEGGSLVCELCGHLSFKLFSTTMEIAEDENRSTRQKTKTQVVKVCRNCYKSNKEDGSHKTGHKKIMRPSFDRSLCGETTGRASRSWHFVRRDILKNKSHALVNHQCYETEFSDKYLSHDSDSDDISDSDTCYEDSDEEAKDVIPLQLSRKGWVSPSALECIKINDERNQKPSPVAEANGVTFDMLVGSELLISRSNSSLVSPDKNLDQLPGEDVVKCLENADDTPLDMIKETTPPTVTQEQPFIDRLSDNGLIDYFSVLPARVRRIKPRQARKHNPSRKKEKVRSKPSIYSGLCDLVTVVNHTKGGHAVNSFSSTLYDNQGLVWRRKDLPQYLNLNTNKYVDSKVGFRERKKEIDSFLVEPKAKQVVAYKTPLVLDNAVDDDRIADLMDVSVSLVKVDINSIKDDIMEKKDDRTSEENSDDTVDTIESTSSTSKKRKKEIPTKTTDVLIMGGSKKTELKGPRQKTKYECLECKIDLTKKSYNSYSRETAPLILLKHFQADTDKVRICKRCLVKKQREKHRQPADSTRKRANPSDSENSPVPTKMTKISTTTSTAAASSKQSKPKTPPKNDTTINKNSGGNIQKKIQNKPNNSSAVNVTIMRNPDSKQLQNMASSQNTRYVIVKTGSSPGSGTVQKLCTTVDGEQALSDITINGKNFKIDSEFKLNELLKDNENAVLSTDSQKDILSQLPSILKRTIGQRNGSPTTYKIVNVLNNSSKKGSVGQCTKILPKSTASSQHGPVTASLPSISLQVQEQIRTTMNTNISKGFQKLKTTNTSVLLPSDGPVKSIKMVQPPRTSIINAKKVPLFSSPLNTPIPKNHTTTSEKSFMKSSSSNDLDVIVNNT